MVVLLLVATSCNDGGLSDEEVAHQIDQAVEQALKQTNSTTTVLEEIAPEPPEQPCRDLFGGMAVPDRILRVQTSPATVVQYCWTGVALWDFVDANCNWASPDCLSIVTCDRCEFSGYHETEIDVSMNWGKQAIEYSDAWERRWGLLWRCQNGRADPWDEC